MALEIIGLFIACAGIATKLVGLTIEVRGDVEELRALNTLTKAISEKLSFIRDLRDRSANKLSAKQVIDIEIILRCTEEYLSLVDRSGYQMNNSTGASIERKAAVCWVFNQRQRRLSLRTIIELLHGSLLALDDAAMLLIKSPVEELAAPPHYSQIYSEDSRTAIIAGLRLWAKQVEEGGSYTDGSMDMIAADLADDFLERDDYQDLDSHSFIYEPTVIADLGRYEAREQHLSWDTVRFSIGQIAGGGSYTKESMDIIAADLAGDYL